MSLICTAEELNPRSTSVDAASTSTLTLDIARPMPAPAMAHSGAVAHAGPHSGAISVTPAMPVALSTKPQRTSVPRAMSGLRDCHIDAVDQPSALSVSGMPEASGE
jgi:hypothetical protein